MAIEVAEVIRVVAVGDIMLGRDLRSVGLSSAQEALSAPVLELLDGDIVTGNLECVLTASEKRHRFSHTHLRSDPEFAASLLKRFSVLSIANNHAYDFLDAGLSDTIAALDDMGIPHVGAGRFREEAAAPVILKVRGQSVAIFGMTSVNHPPDGPLEYVVAEADERMIEAIGAAVPAHDRVIVHFHASGGETPYPTPAARRLHARLRSLGVQVILGHHAHVPQGWECSQGAVNMYGLGDFIFDRLEGERRYALLARIGLTDRGATAEVIPLTRGADLRLSRLEGEELSAFGARMDEANANISAGISDDLFLRGARKGILRLTILALYKDFQSAGLAGVWRHFRRVAGRKTRALARLFGR